MIVRAFAIGFVVLTSAASAGELEPTLGKKGKLLFEESFASPDVAKDWTHAVGKVAAADGVLVVEERKIDEHPCAVRRKLAVQDVAVQFDFTLDGARFLHFGYDPAPGQLKKKGHLFSVVVAPDFWQIIEHNDKSDPGSKTKVHARAATTFEPGKTYTILIECRGPKVTASVEGKEPLQASAADFAVQKPALVFRVGGDDGRPVRLDNVKVWELDESPPVRDGR